MWEVKEKDLNLQDAKVPFGTITFDTFTVESMGTMITTFSSDSLLHQYCSRLWRDSCDNPMPEFTYTEDDWEVKCTVKLPTDALIETAEGLPTSSRADARRSACFAACKLLYEAGALTDYLLPKPHPLDAGVPESSAAADKRPTGAHTPIIPDAFKGKWARGLESVELHAYSVTFEANTKDRDYVNFGLFLEADLGPEAGFLEVDLQLLGRKQGRRVIAKCSPCGIMVFNPNQLRDAKLFQERVLGALLDRKPVTESSRDWSFDRQYLLLPLEAENLEPSTSGLSIDWKSIEKVISNVEYYAVPPNVPEKSFVKLHDGFVALEDVTNSLVLTMHNTKKTEWALYCARELLPDVKAESPMTTMPPDWPFKSYSDYFEGKHNTKLIYVDQPMLEAKFFHKAHNLLAPVKPVARDGEVEELLEDPVHLPLEVCRIKVKGLTSQLTNSVSLLPSFMHRLERFLLALQLRHTLPRSPGASPVPPNLILEAITTRTCKESFNLEGLKMLGDSFLKFFITERLFLIHDKMNESIMSMLRDNLISNAALEKLGRERGIMNYIRDSPFSPEKSWVAPGRTLDTIKAVDLKQKKKKSKKKSTGEQKKSTEEPLKGKTFADVLEALIGAYYVHGGVDAPQVVMNWFGCIVAVDPNIKAEYRARVHGQPKLLSKTQIYEIEKVLNYTFKNKGLLVEAFTHDSCQRDHGDTYQRMEYLGDALLDLLITRHFYESYKELRLEKPGVLSDLRSAAVNNEYFSRVAVRHKLHDYLLYNSSVLRDHVEKYVKTSQSQDSTSTSDAQFGWRGDYGPKVLSDLVESLAGAIYLDSNYNLDKVWDIFKEFLSPLVTPQTLQLEPIAELHQLCAKSKIGDPKYDFERYIEGDFLMSVTIEVKGETIKTFGESEDKNSAKKIAAIEALKALNTLKTLDKLNINKD